jgi:hypothetical protein
MIDQPKPWDLEKLDAYVAAVLQRMGDNRDVMSDEHGEPYFTVYAAGIERDGRLRIDLEADCSAIGMPTNTPMTVKMDPATGPVSWSLEKALIATTDRNLSAEEAGDTLGMDALLEAHRKWVRMDSERGR